MKASPRRFALFLVLATFLAVTITPSALHATTQQDQSSSTTTKAKKKRHSKKEKKEAAAEAGSATAATPAKEETAKKTRHSKKEKESAAANESSAPAAAQSETHTRAASHASPASSMQAQTPPSPGMVWVNTESKVYHKAGSKWYGKTKHGKWMSEAEAQREGDKAAKN